MSLLLSELRLKRSSLVGWAVSVVLLMVLLVVFYPTIRDNRSIDSVYADLPESARSLLGGLDVSTAAGYLNTELFAFFLPAVLLVFGIGWGAASLAGEEESRTLDLLLAQPLRRRSAYLQKAAGVGVGLVLLGLATAVPLLVSNDIVEFELPVANVLAVTVQMLLFCLALSLAAQAVAAATGRKLVGTAVVAAYAALSYLVYGLAPTVSWLEPLEPLCLWRWYLGNDPLTQGFGLVEVVVLVAVGALALLAGARAFERRDLRS